MGRGAYGTATVLTLVLILRAIPYLVTETVFSTDSWGLLRNTLVFERESPISLLNNEFDGYNNYWPVPSVSLAILRFVTVFPLELGYLCISLLSTLVFAIIIAKLERASPSLWDFLLPGLLFNVVMMTSAFTKEGYAYSLFAIALFLTMVRGGRLRRSEWLVLGLLLSSLVLCHHLTSLALGLILSGYLVRWFFNKIFYHREAPINVGTVLLSLILLSFFAGVHYAVLGKNTFISNYVSYWYAIATVSWMTVLSLVPFDDVARRMRRYLLFLFVITSLALYMSYTSIQSIGLKPDTGMIIAIASALLLIPNAVARSRENRVPVGGWLTGLPALVIVLMLEGVTFYYWVIYRALTFILILVAIRRLDGLRLKLSTCIYSILSVTLFILTLAGWSVLLGWHWLYRPSEIGLAKFLSNYASTSLKLVSDTKYCSILRGFFRIHSTSSIAEKGYIVLDEYMFTKGWLTKAGVVEVLEGEPSDWLKSSAGVLYSSDGVFRKWLVWLS